MLYNSCCSYYSLKDLELEDRQSKLQQDMRERMAQSKSLAALIHSLAFLSCK